MERARLDRVPAAIAALLLAVTGADGQSPGAPRSGLRVEVTERHYELDEATLSGVIDRLNAMRLEGPDGPPSQGLTDWGIHPEWRPSGAGGRCRVADLGLSVQIRITLPAWTRYDAATPEERARWDRIEGAIREHEYRHRDLTVDQAGALFDRLTSLSASGCAALNRAFAGAMSLAQDRIEAAHGALDSETPRRLVVGL